MGAVGATVPVGGGGDAGASWGVVGARAMMRAHRQRVVRVRDIRTRITFWRSVNLFIVVFYHN
jgi:hypothetical protein